VGNRDLKWSWVPRYAFGPLTGTALACIFFLLVNGGIVNSQNPSNRLWIVGLAALVGLFSSQGFEKLKKIFEAIFTTVPPAADKPLPRYRRNRLGHQSEYGPTYRRKHRQDHGDGLRCRHDSTVWNGAVPGGIGR
jgi:hypothetical protein